MIDNQDKIERKHKRHDRAFVEIASLKQFRELQLRFLTLRTGSHFEESHSFQLKVEHRNMLLHWLVIVNGLYAVCTIKHCLLTIESGRRLSC